MNEYLYRAESGDPGLNRVFKNRWSKRELNYYVYPHGYIYGFSRIQVSRGFRLGDPVK